MCSPPSPQICIFFPEVFESKLWIHWLKEFLKHFIMNFLKARMSSHHHSATATAKKFNVNTIPEQVYRHITLARLLSTSLIAVPHAQTQDQPRPCVHFVLAPFLWSHPAPTFSPFTAVTLQQACAQLSYRMPTLWVGGGFLLIRFKVCILSRPPCR